METLDIKSNAPQLYEPLLNFVLKRIPLQEEIPMDIAPRHSLQSPLKYAHEAFPTPILPQAKTYLSVDDALQLIDRKITNIRVPITFSLDTPLLQFEYDCETVRFTTRVVIKPLMVALLGVCMILAIYQFIDKAETQQLLIKLR